MSLQTLINDPAQLQQAVGVFVMLAGFIVGLGAVTVIDCHGFLARKSPYWTEATIRAHKVTKPLIWLGLLLAIIGGSVFYSARPYNSMLVWQGLLAVVLILNGGYLSFVVSPSLLAQEAAGKARKLLSRSLQQKITVSFLFSIVGWWGSLALLVLQMFA